MVICLEQGADLFQLMPLPLTVSCFSNFQISFTFWYRPTRVVLEKGPLNGCVCVLVKHWQKLSCVDSCNFMSILLLLWCVLWWLNWGTGTRRRHINMSLSCRVSEWAKQQWALVILLYYVCERYCRGQRLIVWCTPVCVCWTVAEWTCMARRIRDWLRRSLVIA